MSVNVNVYENTIYRERLDRTSELQPSLLEKKNDEYMTGIVISSDGDKQYKVEIDITSGKSTCTCPDFIHRGVVCKHILKLILDNPESIHIF